MDFLVFAPVSRHTIRVVLPTSPRVSSMVEFKTFLTKAGRYFFSSPSQSSTEPQQRRLMVIALSLLLFALGLVLYHDRDFWFPDVEGAEDQPEQTVPVTN